MKNLTKSLLVVTTIAWLSVGCGKDEQAVAPTNDNEAITTAVLQLTNKANPAQTVTATVDKLNATPDFSQASLTLTANTTYTGTILLSDKTKTPAVDVSAAIKTEQNEHLFVYTPSPATLLTVTITDRDTNPTPYPVGLTVEVTTKAAGTGKLNVVLRHQPGAKNGTPTPGTTDLDTNFDVVVK